MKALALAVALFAPTFVGATEHVVAILPITSAAASPEAAAAIDSAMRDALERRGWNVVPAADVEAFLEAERIRYLDSLSPKQLSALRTRLGAQSVIVGSIVSYRERGTDPFVAIAARMITPEGVIWGEVAALSGAESEGAFGSGRRSTPEALSKEVAQRLLAAVPRPERTADVRLRSRKRLGGPSTYRSASLPKNRVRRVCVLPFTTMSAEAARSLLAILTVRLEATGEFDVVEQAEFREAMAAAKFRAVSVLTSNELAVLGQHLGTTTFLRGQVHTFRDAGAGRSEVQIDMNLSDVATGEVLWAVTHQRRGSDYSGILQRGVVGNVVTLADKVVSETIAAQQRARPRQPARRAAARD